MALYWPDQKVALDIIDDPGRRPADVPDDWDVFETTVAQTKDLHEARKVWRALGERMGHDMSFMDDPEWQRRNAILHEALMSELTDEYF